MRMKETHVNETEIKRKNKEAIAKLKAQQRAEVRIIYCTSPCERMESFYKDLCLEQDNERI